MLKRYGRRRARSGLRPAEIDLRRAMWVDIDAMRPIMDWAAGMVANKCPYSSPWDMAVAWEANNSIAWAARMAAVVVLDLVLAEVNLAQGLMVEGFLRRPVPLVRNHLVNRACTVPVVVVQP